MQRVRIINHLNEKLSINLARPDFSGLAITYINGLDPVKASINFDEMAIIDGSKFNSSRVTSRNIVFGIRPYKIPGTSITELRHKIYKYFPLKRKIQMFFDNGIRRAYTYGYVESNNTNIFSKGVESIISIICEDPYLYDVNSGSFNFRTSPGLFTFPFSNESLVNRLLIMGNLALEREETIIYTGEASIGFLLHIHVNQEATDLKFIETKSLGVLGIDSDKLVEALGDDLSPGDDIYISTVIGRKYAYLIRRGVTFNILDLLLDNPTWFQLEPGENKYAYSLGTGYGNVDFRISFDIAYEGM